MVPRLQTLVLLVVMVSAAVADGNHSATEPALTTATTTTSSTSATPTSPTSSSVAVVTPHPTVSTSPGLYPRDSNNATLYYPEPRFPYVDLVVECFAQLSLPCAQRKMVVYLDQLNRARKVSIIGHFLELIKTRPDTAPPITEEVLTARQIQDQDSLSRLLEMMTERFMDSHVLRLNMPLIEDGKLITAPVDINFVEPQTENSREGRGHGDKKKKKQKKKASKKMKKKGKKMMKMMMAIGKKMVDMTGKMILFKMMMMFPIAMKKSMIGGAAGMMSIGIMKLMMLKALFQKLKSFLSKCKGGGGGGGGFLGGGDGYFGGGGSCGGDFGGYDRRDQNYYSDTSPSANTNSYSYSRSPYSYYYIKQKERWLK